MRPTTQIPEEPLNLIPAAVPYSVQHLKFGYVGTFLLGNPQIVGVARVCFNFKTTVRYH